MANVRRKPPRKQINIRVHQRPAQQLKRETIAKSNGIREVAGERRAMKNLVQTEEQCLAFCRKAGRWLLDFRADNGLFHISLTSGQVLTATAHANVATSHIGAVINELPKTNAAIVPEESLLRRAVEEARSRYLQLQPSEVLPLKTFGTLPLFSTAFFAEFVASDNQCSSSLSYAIATRRLLYLVHSLLLHEPRDQDTPHPYLLFRLACAMAALKRVLVISSAARTNLVALLSDEQSQRRSLPEVDEGFLSSILALGDLGSPFVRQFLSTLSGENIEDLLHLIEQHALKGASTELAWHSTPRKDRADPAALLFSIATLSLLNRERHDLLLGESLRLLIDGFGPGSLVARNPFHIDSRGRALFVTTLESASALLSIALSRFDKLTTTDLESIVHVTEILQSRLIEDVNEIPCSVSTGTVTRFGWCSDRAFSKLRIDSWVTVEAFTFLSRRLHLLALAKKRFILSQYSWLPASKCNPDWQELVDPNLGDNDALSLLETIGSIVDNEQRPSKQAPLFLLYGPPGTAKTTIAYALARKMDWDLITLSPSDFVVNSLDQIEQRSRELFFHMTNINRCVILFDEMDTLLRDREKLGTTSPGMMIEFVVPALLPKLQQFRDYAARRNVAAFFLTNYYERLDSAVIRGGRIDNHIMVLPYTRAGQMEICRKIITKQIENDTVALSTALDRIQKTLSSFPCNLTYRDLEWICSNVLEGGDGMIAIERRRGELGISPLNYRVARGAGAYRELYAFMKRYRGEAVTSQDMRVEPKEAITYFEGCAAALPVYGKFFNRWIEQLSSHD